MINQEQMKAIAVRKNWTSLYYGNGITNKSVTADVSLGASDFNFWLFDPLAYSNPSILGWADQNYMTTRFYVGYCCVSISNLVITGTSVVRMGTWRFNATPNGGDYAQLDYYLRLTQSSGPNEVFTWDFGGTDQNEFGCIEVNAGTSAGSSFSATISACFLGNYLTR